MPKPKLPVPTEHQEQAFFFQRIALDPRTRDVPIFAIPNGGHRHKAVAAKLKAEGVRAGVPDVFVAWPAPTPDREWSDQYQHHGLFLEFKRQRGGVTSDAQRDWHTRLRTAGYRVEVVAGADAAFTALLEYLGH